MLQNTAARVLVPAVRNNIQKRYQSAVPGPARVKVSSVEKFILGGGMCASLLFVPAWVLYHIRDYKGEK